jgi:hypothetical protein
MGAFVAVAVGRYQYGLEAATFSRYIYTAAVLLIPLAAAILAGMRLPTSRLAIVGAVLVLEVSVIGNVLVLMAGAGEAQYRSGITRAAIAAGLTVESDRAVHGVPAQPCIGGLVERYGVPSGPVDPETQGLARRAFAGETVPLWVSESPC